jgi:hypothetical protein
MGWKNIMSQSSDNIDRLEFSWDLECAQKLKVQQTTKITATTERHLEEYFAFLEDVVPSFNTLNDRHIPGSKVFQLD